MPGLKCISWKEWEAYFTKRRLTPQTKSHTALLKGLKWFRNLGAFSRHKHPRRLTSLVWGAMEARCLGNYPLGIFQKKTSKHNTPGSSCWSCEVGSRHTNFVATLSPWKEWLREPLAFAPSAGVDGGSDDRERVPPTPMNFFTALWEYDIL